MKNKSIFIGIFFSLIVGWGIGQRWPFHDELLEGTVNAHAIVWDAQASKYAYPKGYCGSLFKDLAWSGHVGDFNSDLNQFVHVCMPEKQ